MARPTVAAEAVPLLGPVAHVEVPHRGELRIVPHHPNEEGLGKPCPEAQVATWAVRALRVGG